MSLIVPDSQELEVINDRLNAAMTMRLYGNDVTPTGLTTAAAFTEITGGGYAAVALAFANWTITDGDPTQAIYDSIITWTFTDIIDPPGTIYGYYVTRDSDGELMWSERFPSAIVPFSPVNGSLVRVLPKYSVQSQF